MKVLIDENLPRRICFLSFLTALLLWNVSGQGR
jgi:hypothetical protein